MTTRTASPESAAKILKDKADDCMQIARSQHEAARKQHLSADKLHELARELKSDAAEIEARPETKVDTAKG
jgi:hypothetical protein